MQTGEFEASLVTLNEKFNLNRIEGMIASKVKEKAEFQFDWREHKTRWLSRISQLREAFENSKLPEKPNREAVNELLIQIRLGQ